MLCGGRKIAGAAQRRTRVGLLVQGSIQPTNDLPGRLDWEHAMIEVGADRFEISWVVFEPDVALLNAAHELLEHKYARDAYNQKR